ncbi:hypothetical protein [Streptomyces sp. NBC_00893]|uniref:hypothetical protein n=1 Tax=Streptomyces sp. NBC_00893 TaxID=2975862 RepID=UPI00224CDB01|nr:hypothetical protein [Streptomyces sp. NBC_00893]MCX4847053.1 hypothetical protein [Streptomyces sp. NBC_00893]
MSRREYEYGPEGENGPEREHRRERRNDRTGNGIVNHDPGTAGATGADGTDGADGAGGAAPGADGAGGPGGAGGADRASEAGETAELGGLSSLFGSGAGRNGGPGADSGGGAGGGPGTGGGADLDEVALRRMLQGAVRNIEPGDGTLDHLQRAVPARRAKRRQAVVGLAAAALLIGTAVPAFVHVANSDGSNTANPAIAGHGEQAQGGNGTDTESQSGGKSSSGNTDGQADGGRNHPTSTSSPSDGRGQGADGNLSGGAADPSGSAVVAMRTCDPGQLGVASAETGAAGADGTVYGTFRISNVSGTDCSVSSSGSVGFQAIGAADPARIAVVQHTAGDAAAGLPDPSQEQGTVLLKPSMSYEVKFAWVPKDTCPTVGGSPSPTPTDDAGGASGAAAAGAGTGSGDGTSETVTQFGSEDGGSTQDGSVAVMHTPEPGAPVAETKIANACSGTIYRTGVLAPAT